MTTALIFSAGAFADGGGSNNSSLQSSIVGSSPNVMVGGVSSAGAQWMVSQSTVSIQANGQATWQVQVQVQNLLLASGSGFGTTGNVHMIAASVVCGGSGGMVVATTPIAGLDRSGSAQIQANLSLGRSCIAPVVLVRVANPGTPAGSFIASTGLSLNSPNQSSVDDNDRE
jgi:hypothetical protein